MEDMDMRLSPKAIYNREYKAKRRADPEYRKWEHANCHKYYQTHKESIRNTEFKRKYGITLEQYQELFTKQNGRCAICQQHQLELKKRLNVDHCHRTNIVRGLLCHNCNTALGSLRDSITILDAAKLYLQMFNKGV